MIKNNPNILILLIFVTFILTMFLFYVILLLANTYNAFSDEKEYNLEPKEKNVDNILIGNPKTAQDTALTKGKSLISILMANELINDPPKVFSEKMKMIEKIIPKDSFQTEEILDTIKTLKKNVFTNLKDIDDRISNINNQIKFIAETSNKKQVFEDQISMAKKAIFRRLVANFFDISKITRVAISQNMKYLSYITSMDVFSFYRENEALAHKISKNIYLLEEIKLILEEIEDNYFFSNMIFLKTPENQDIKILLDYYKNINSSKVKVSKIKREIEDLDKEIVYILNNIIFVTSLNDIEAL